mmetsp:Transcript_68536/g.164602  ORF Transcript_68536/g.164602 Transcript_68536/m.164602 type:complete len:843 (-) Transcript_68536:315-2843(-)
MPAASTSAVTSKPLSRTRAVSQACLQANNCLGGGGSLQTFQSVPRRRLQKEAHLQNVITHVAENLGGEPAVSEFSTNYAISPASSSRRNVSLRLPRVASPRGGDQSPGGNDGEINDHSGVAGDEQLEELRSQNEVLKKSLAMLQASVVESMKGNKAQFMGNGFFKHHKAVDGFLGKQAAMLQAITAAPDSELDAQLEELREETHRLREELRKALSDRDEALQQAQSAQSQESKMQQRNKDLEAEVAKLEKERKHEQDEHAKAEAALAPLQAKVSSLEAQIEELRESAASKSESLCLTEASVDRLQEELSKLGEEHGRAVAEAEDAKREVARLSQDAQHREAAMRNLRCRSQGAAEHLLMRSFSTRRSVLRDCLRAWEACSLASREDSMNQRAEQLQEQATSAEEQLHQLRHDMDAAVEESRQMASQAEARANASAEKEQEAKEEVIRLKQSVSTLEAKLRRLDEEAQTARSSSKAAAAQLDALRARSSEGQQAIDRMREMEAELAKLKEADELNSQKIQDSSDREAALRKDLEEARKKEASSQQQRDEARKRSIEVENQRKAAVKELEALRAGSGKAEEEVRRMRQRAEEAEKKVKELQKEAMLAEKKAAELEAQRQQAHESTKSDEDATSKRDAELLEAERKLAGMAAQNSDLSAEISRLKSALAEAKCDAKSSADKARVLSEEQKSLERALEEAKAGRQDALRHAEEIEAGPAKFLAEARQALVDARQNIRIMVTAPKVAINICNNEFGLHTPFPFKAIQDAVRDEVMPKFARVFAVSEQSHDAEIRKGVQEMVEQLALTLQTKVHELMPKAEGTCNWEGFGAKCGTLSGSISAAQFRKG